MLKLTKINDFLVMPETLCSSEEENDADIIDMEQNPETGEWESKNPKQDILERPGLVDKNKMEDKIRETKERMQKREEAPESESVLDVPEKGKNRNNEGTAAGLAGETRAEKKENQETKEKSPRELAEELFGKTHPKKREEEAKKMAVERRLDDGNYWDYCKDEISSAAEEEMTEQERQFFKKTGEFEVNGVFREIGEKLGLGSIAPNIYKSDVEGLLAGGMAIKDIRNIKQTMFGKWLLPGEKKPISSEELDRRVNEGLVNKVREMAIKDAEREQEKNRQEFLDIYTKSFEAEQKEEKTEKIPMLPEGPIVEEGESLSRAEKKEKVKQAAKKAKIEKAENMPDEEKLALLNELEREWDGANQRHRKIKAIEKAIDAGEYKCKTEGGKKLKGKKAKDEMERFKEELKDKNRELSGKIINTANQLAGRKLREEAREATGYVPDKKNPDEEKQKQFRAWLTKETQNIFKEQVDKIEESSGMRIKTMRWLEKLMAGLPDMPTREKTGIEQRETIDAEEPSPAEKPLIKKGKKLKPVMKRRLRRKK